MAAVFPTPLLALAVPQARRTQTGPAPRGLGPQGIDRMHRIIVSTLSCARLFVVLSRVPNASVNCYSFCARCAQIRRCLWPGPGEFIHLCRPAKQGTRPAGRTASREPQPRARLAIHRMQCSGNRGGGRPARWADDLPRSSSEDQTRPLGRQAAYRAIPLTSAVPRPVIVTAGTQAGKSLDTSPATLTCTSRCTWSTPIPATWAEMPLRGLLPVLAAT